MYSILLCILIYIRCNYIEIIVLQEYIKEASRVVDYSRIRQVSTHWAWRIRHIQGLILFELRTIDDLLMHVTHTFLMTIICSAISSCISIDITIKDGSLVVELLIKSIR